MYLVPEIRSIGKTLTHNYTKRRELEQELVKLKGEEKPLWAKYMESRRLWKRFKRLLRGNFPISPVRGEKLPKFYRKLIKKRNTGLCRQDSAFNEGLPRFIHPRETKQRKDFSIKFLEHESSRIVQQHFSFLSDLSSPFSLS